MRKKTKEFAATVAVIAIAALSSAMLGSIPSAAAAQQANEPAIDGDDIGGVVSGPNGPEAGVWVIAESVDLPTKFAKIVVSRVPRCPDYEKGAPAKQCLSCWVLATISLYEISTKLVGK